MTTDSISSSLRKLVALRADNRCEYCLISQNVVLHKHEPDHIIPRQRDGTTGDENLAHSCMRCNRHKGPNIGSFDPLDGVLVPFFNPRTQIWEEHFKLQGAVIQPLTPEGRVTVKILNINSDTRITERQNLINNNLYP